MNRKLAPQTSPMPRNCATTDSWRGAVGVSLTNRPYRRLGGPVHHRPPGVLVDAAFQPAADIRPFALQDREHRRVAPSAVLAGLVAAHNALEGGAKLQD